MEVAWDECGALPRIIIEAAATAVRTDVLACGAAGAPGASGAGGAHTSIILIDGMSGAGKTTFERAFRAELEAEIGADLRKPIHHVSLDLWYPGWDGLDLGSRHSEQVVADLAAGRTSSYEPWDWEGGQALAPVTVEPGGVAVVEGCGALTAANRAHAAFAIWVKATGGEAQRYERAIGRDGEIYRPHWDRWAAQDEARVRRLRPRQLVDLVVLT